MTRIQCWKYANKHLFSQAEIMQMSEEIIVMKVILDDF